RNLLSFCQELLRQPKHHGSFACPSDGEVSNTDYSGVQTFLFEPVLGVKRRSISDICPIQQRKRPNSNLQRARQLHRSAPPKCLAISASARCVAPRLLSTSAFAVSPILRWRSGSRSNPI